MTSKFGSGKSAARMFADFLQEELQVEDRELTPLERTFNEQFPPLDRFVGDAQFLNFDRDGLYLGEIQYDLVRHMEQILLPKTYIEMVKEWGIQYAPVRYVNELVACWGKGSGKDMSVQIGFSRAANILLSLNSPQEYFNVPSHTIIHMMNVAASSSQAHGVFFKPLRHLLVHSPWFADKFEGKELPSDKAVEINFKKSISLISGHSDAETLEGKNLIVAVADEIAAFKMEKDARGGTAASKTAEGLVDMLKSSASTRFPANYKLVQISFPRAKGDAILTALNKAKASEAEYGEQSTYYASGPYKTWDVNPKYENVERVKIPGLADPVPNYPSIIEDYTKSISFAQAKYECKPDAAVNRYFKDDAAILGSFEDAPEVDPVGIEYVVRIDGDDPKAKIEQWDVDFKFSDDFWPKNGAIYAIHADMAVTGDRAGVAMSHVESYDIEVDPETKEEIQLPNVVVDFAIAFEADSGAVHPLNDTALPREIQIRWFRKLVMELIRRGFPVERASMDGFQSVDSLQILASRGLDAVRYSLDRTPEGYRTLRDVMYSGRLRGPNNPILIEEIAALNTFARGKIDHLPGGSKDISDAVAGSVVGAILMGGEVEDDPDQVQDAVKADMAAEMQVIAQWGEDSIDQFTPTFGSSNQRVFGPGGGSVFDSPFGSGTGLFG